MSFELSAVLISVSRVETAVDRESRQRTGIKFHGDQVFGSAQVL
jgi:hypothetical protein